MKFLIALSLSVFSLGAFAQDDLGSMKQDANSYIDQKMSSLQEAKSCINNADSKEAFKACKYDMHKEMKMQKMEMKREEMQEHKQKMEEEKQKEVEKNKESQEE
ncbi:MAG: hypothetical protein ACLGHN_09145 [Bacteriovoracia bacterium]